MTAHITAAKEDIAKIVLMPGDPLRAKHIAENMLDAPRLVNQTRNAFYYTGTYKGVPVTIGASGMGCPSIGIYSYELYTAYNVECIMRIGTAGGYSSDVKVYDVINVDKAYSESTYAREAFGYTEDFMVHQGKAHDLINQAASQSGIAIKDSNIHSSDVFYRAKKGTPEIAAKNNCVCVEMEAYALFSNARYLKKMAATLLTISDIIPTGENMSADQRQNSLDSMSTLALESVVLINAAL
jgi:purine-nucleoside phosphorylase